MTKVSPPYQDSGYLDALSQEIERKLNKALTLTSQKSHLLQKLFADIALEVDDRAKHVILKGKEISVYPGSNWAEIQLCFYDVLADYYAKKPDNGRHILHFIVQLWSHSFASHIFALLFHKWMFEVQLEHTEVLRYSSALVQGATNVFWIDILANTNRFINLFHYLVEEVALKPVQLHKLSLQAQRDLFLLLSRFILFYNSEDKIESFLAHFPTYPNAFLVGTASDYFVIELSDQLQKLKVEPVLLHYLSKIKVLQGMELRMTTSIRLKTCLYSYTSPGGPMYPTRAVRHAAWEALDVLFPIGRHPRHLISMVFRLLYPWYWPSSCWNFLVSCCSAVLYAVPNLLPSFWQSVVTQTQGEHVQ